LGKLGAVYSLQLRVIDVKTGGIDKAFSKSYSGDISHLLEGMREAACCFSEIKYVATQDVEAAPHIGLTFMQINAQGFYEYKNEKDGSVLIEIPAGSYSMGCDSGEKDEKPAHAVYLDQYYIGKYEVTIAQYRKFCYSTGKNMLNQPSWNINDDYPIVDVNWNDSKAYCDWAGLRLPNEAEWEKAARGTDGRIYPWGNIWYVSACNSSDRTDSCINTSTIGKYTIGASPYGAYDMSGNVWEWCQDWYDDSYYEKSSNSNPVGPLKGLRRVIRGGSWYTDAYGCRSSIRGSLNPAVKGDDFGFRPAK